MEDAAVEADFDAVLAKSDAAALAGHVRKLTQWVTLMLQSNASQRQICLAAQQLLSKGKAQAAGAMLAKATAVPEPPITDARLVVIAAAQDAETKPEAT